MAETCLACGGPNPGAAWTCAGCLAAFDADLDRTLPYVLGQDGDDLAVLVRGGGVVELGPGTYKLQGLLDVPAGLTIRHRRTQATGPLIEAKGKGAGLRVAAGRLQLVGVAIQGGGITVDGGALYFSGGGVRKAKGDGVLVRNDGRALVMRCEIGGSTGHGVAAADQACVQLEYGLIGKNGGSGLQVRDHAQAEVEGTQFSGNKAHGVEARDQAVVRIEALSAGSNKGWGIWAGGEAQVAVFGESRGKNVLGKQQAEGAARIGPGVVPSLEEAEAEDDPIGFLRRLTEGAFALELGQRAHDVVAALGNGDPAAALDRLRDELAAWTGVLADAPKVWLNPRMPASAYKVVVRNAVVGEGVLEGEIPGVGLMRTLKAMVAAGASRLPTEPAPWKLLKAAGLEDGDLQSLAAAAWMQLVHENVPLGAAVAGRLSALAHRAPTADALVEQLRRERRHAVSAMREGLAPRAIGAAELAAVEASMAENAIDGPWWEDPVATSLPATRLGELIVVPAHLRTALARALPGVHVATLEEVP